MKLVFYSIVLNQHQAPLAEILWEDTNHSFCFVELTNVSALQRKGDTNDYSSCPYLLRAWESLENKQKAMELVQTAECCVFGGALALPFQKERMKLGLLSFDMGERWLKKGLLNLCSPAIVKMFVAYWLGGWRKKPLYKLCMSAYAKSDHAKLGMYKDKCYKWGYFTSIGSYDNRYADKDDVPIEHLKPSESTNYVRLMWCARFLTLKHPELPVRLAHRLKRKGYRFVLSMYGDEGNVMKHEVVFAKKRLETMIKEFDVGDCVRLMGTRPNSEILQAMRENSIFLFTSDRREGWGFVANEAMSNGCVLVASDAIGSTPYLIEDGFNGYCFKSGDLESFTEKVEWLLTHPQDMIKIQKNAYIRMREVWSPQNAAKSLLKLIDDFKNGYETSIMNGPCSKA